MLFIENKYFKDHPERILGVEHTHHPRTGRLLTDQFGKPRPEVWGSMEEALARIEVPKPERYDHFVPHFASKPIIKQQAGQEERVKKALKKARKAERTSETYELKALADSILEYNQGVEYKNEEGETAHYNISKEEIQVWVTYQVAQGLFDKEVIGQNAWAEYLVESPAWQAWQEAGLVAYNGSAYIPSPLYYSGNIYERITRLKENREQIKAVIGEDGYLAQLESLERVRPRKLLITDDDSRKLRISPFDKIWKEIKITALADGSEIESRYGIEPDIGYIFNQYYLEGLSEEDLQHEGKRATPYEIHRYWINKERFPRGTTQQEKAAIQRNTTIIGTILFDRFLIEMLTEQDKARIAELWNAKRNNYAPVPYHKIPVGFEISRKFKGGELKVRPAQREGVAFLNSRGTGIVAYDVGVGKTMAAILGMADGFTKGMFKRPLVVVPQKVYKKWIAEINGVVAEKDIYRQVEGKKRRVHKKGELIAEGILPHISVNDYDNLGTQHIGKAVDPAGVAIAVPEYSITMVTYEGLVKIGFNEQTEGQLHQRLREALSQGESGRARALLEESAEKWIDEALQKTELDIEELGIDAILVDEAHNFRNLFMDIKGDVGENGEREQKNFQSSSGSKPSGRALSLFMLNAYIQSKHNRRNTFGLTATPFTNRATEIYSIMALYDYDGMKDYDCYNIAQFCTSFIDETIEDSWTAQGKFQPRPVVRGYNNLPILQSMVFRAINYKTGEEANIQRPEKVILPLLTDENGIPLSEEYMVETRLRPTAQQQNYLNQVTSFARNVPSDFDKYYARDQKGRTLIALNAARAVTFSPFALNLGGRSLHEAGSVTPERFVQGSPKIQYAVECIRSVRQYHQRQGTAVSGQIIYSDRGTEWFGHIKKYLVENVGFAEKEVEIFYGGVSKGKREKIKEKFLSNEVKVIIGSSTMREGVDLQKHGSVIYMCYIDWNPTDVHQLFGRIWRFGNKFSHVRIAVPLIENSSDVFTWQKLSEKMSRLNSIWTRANGTRLFEESDLNAEELKKGLINDPEELARYEIEEAAETLTSELTIVEGALSRLAEAGRLKDTYNELTKELEDIAQRALTAPKLRTDATEESVKRLQEMQITDDIRSIYRIVRAYARLDAGFSSYRFRSKVDQHIKYTKRINRLEKTILANFNLTIYDDFGQVTQQYRQRFEELQEKIEKVKSKENLEALTERYRREKEKEEKNAKTVEQRVDEFQRLNYLLDCEYGIHNCDIYGRVEEIKSGKAIEVERQERPVVEEEFTYKMDARLEKMMPRSQHLAVEEILRESEDPEGYVRTVLLPLEEQVNAIPSDMGYGRKADGKKRSRDELIVQAHYFYGFSDWYIISYDEPSDRAFGYVILNGDVEMSELGAISLKTLHYKKGVELDFFWQPKYLPEVLHEKDSAYFPAPKVRYAQAVQRGEDTHLQPPAKWLKAKRPEKAEKQVASAEKAVPTPQVEGNLEVPTIERTFKDMPEKQRISQSVDENGNYLLFYQNLGDGFNIDYYDSDTDQVINRKQFVKGAFETAATAWIGMASQHPSYDEKRLQGLLEEFRSRLPIKIDTALRGLDTLYKLKKDQSTRQKIRVATKGLETLKKLKAA